MQHNNGTEMGTFLLTNTAGKVVHGKGV